MQVYHKIICYESKPPFIKLFEVSKCVRFILPCKKLGAMLSKLLDTTSEKINLDAMTIRLIK